jgi:predicted nucleotidyltransferase
MPLTIQEIDRAETERIRAAREPLIAALTRAADGAPWHYLLFGSLARGTARRGSDADIAIVDAGARWREAEKAALDACDALDIEADIAWWEYMGDAVREEALRDGIRCG